MNLKRTTYIPLDDTRLATTIFKSFIEKEMMVLMIIIGDSPAIRKGVKKADELAKLSYFNLDRWVLWARNEKILASIFKKYLKASDAHNTDKPYESIKCFCFSPIQDKVDGVILKNVALTYASLQQSFFRAQAHDVPFLAS